MPSSELPCGRLPRRDLHAISFRVANHTLVVSIARAAWPIENLLAVGTEPSGERIDGGCLADDDRDVRETQGLILRGLRHVGARHELESRAFAECQETRAKTLARIFVNA